MAPFAQDAGDGLVKVYFPAGGEEDGVKVYQGQLGVTVTMSAEDWQLALVGRVPGVKRPGLPRPSLN